jgi:phosphate-selective porin
MRLLPFIIFLLPFLFLSNRIVGQKLSRDSGRAVVEYTEKGFQFATNNGMYLMHLEFRLQTRIAYPYESDPVNFNDFLRDRAYIGINRARMKVGGHALTPYFKYYLEYELFASNLLDFRVMWEQFEWLNIKIGQWKAHYNRERVISSGKQQTMDRSILNYAFTIDRQQGLSLYGRLKGDGALDFNYWASVFMGTGRGATGNDDEHLMYMGRLQWNAIGEPIPFVGSDLIYHNIFSGLIAVSAVTNRSPFTRFSQAGGGQLDGFEPGIDDQYKVNQWMQETAFMYHGFSWQQEFHWKEINDRVNNTRTVLIGNLVQLGYFLNCVFPRFPEPLELFARYSIYDPDTDVPNNNRQEFSAGANWFFNAHRDKLTIEYAYLAFQAETAEIRDGSRIRLQWDISF